MDDHVQGSQQNTHYPKEKLPKIITHKWKQGDLLEAPNLLPMKGPFVTKFETKANCQLQNYKKMSSIVVAILSLVFHSIWSAS